MLPNPHQEILNHRLGMEQELRILCPETRLHPSGASENERRDGLDEAPAPAARSLVQTGLRLNLCPGRRAGDDQRAATGAGAGDSWRREARTSGLEDAEHPVATGAL